MITSDIEELNISDLNEFEGDASTMLTENAKGLWRKVTFDPNKDVSGTVHPFGFQNNEIVSASNVDDSFVQRVSEGNSYVDTFYDFSTGIPTWGIQTSDSATFRWEPSQQQAGNGTDPRIDVDRAGNAVMLFKNTNQNDLRVRRYNAASQSWSSITVLDTLLSSGTSPDIKLSASGIAIAVWVHNTGLGRVIQAAYYDPVTLSWTSNIDLSLPTATADFEPHVAINDNGDGIAVWNAYQDNNTTLIQAAHFNGATKTWQGFPTNLTFSNESFDSRVGIDNNGNVIAIWTHSPFGTGGSTYIESSTYDPVTDTWSNPVIISGNPDHATLPDLSVTSNGDAMAVWIDNTGNNQHILRANKYSRSTKTWKTIEYDIDLINSNLTPVKVAMSNIGTAIIVDSDQVTGVSGLYNIEAYHYDPTTDLWDVAPKILEQTTFSSASPQVAMDDVGNGVAIWVQTNGQNYYIESSTYMEVSQKWSLPDQISTVESNVYTPQVVAKQGSQGLSAINFAAAVWEFIDGDGNPRITGSPATINPHIITANDSKISFAFRKVQEVGEPEVDTDAATKFYVDNAIAALNQVFMETLQNQGFLKEKPEKKKENPSKEVKKKVKKNTKK